MTIEIQRELRDIKERLERLEKVDLGPVTGTYVPTYLGGTSAGVTTYSLQSGEWIRTGRLLVVRGQVVWTAATGTGNAQVSLPFAIETGANFTGTLYLINVTFAAGSPSMLMTSGTSFFTIGSPTTNAGQSTSQIEAAGNILFTCSYFID